MTDYLQRFLRWLGSLLVAWGTPPAIPAPPPPPPPPYLMRSLSDVEADALRDLFAPPPPEPPEPVVLDPCPICGAAWTAHHCPYDVAAPERVCEVCGVSLPVDAVRTHDGHWLCRRHKEPS